MRFACSVVEMRKAIFYHSIRADDCTIWFDLNCYINWHNAKSFIIPRFIAFSSRAKNKDIQSWSRVVISMQWNNPTCLSHSRDWVVFAFVYNPTRGNIFHCFLSKADFQCIQNLESAQKVPRATKSDLLWATFPLSHHLPTNNGIRVFLSGNYVYLSLPDCFIDFIRNWN
jgi:hypothetical protein